MTKQGTVIAAAICLSCRVGTAEEPTPPPGFQRLFNGENLSGWLGADRGLDTSSTDGAKENQIEPEPPFEGHWTVEVGELVSDGKGGMRVP